MKQPTNPSFDRNWWKASSSLALAFVTILVGCSHVSEGSGANLPYPIVDTGQIRCYDTSKVIPCPAGGEPFVGQDAQHAGRAPAFTLSADGRTVRDDVTGLTWQRSPDTSGDGNLTQADKLTFSQALSQPAALNAAKFGGFTDWRLPTIKELYSLIDFRGTDPSGLAGNDTSGLTPFIDTTYFRFAYGSAPERIIDSQYASSTLYVAGSSLSSSGKLFGVNFADGRIKGYDLSMPDGSVKTFFVQCVRGNPDYGTNRFTDKGDGTVLDSASGLEWTHSDSGTPMTWQEALAWVETRNAEKFLGHSDWRLPDAKELQSILDYTRSPDTTGSAAIDPAFSATQITNEGGKSDFPWYWASTTHATFNGMGSSGVYVCFGRCGGWQKMPPTASCYSWVDVHGAGAQRGDPKAPSGIVTMGSACNGGTAYGLGPQGDVQRGVNHVRLVRTATAEATSTVTRFIPIVLDVTGRAHYTSELTLANRGTTPAAIELTYTPAPAYGASESGTVTVPLAAGHQLVTADAIAYLRANGLSIPTGNQGGSLRATFSGLSSPDVSFAGVRVTAPSESGRAGVSYSAQRTDQLPTGRSWLLGLRSSDVDRTNIAMANASTSSSITLLLTLVSGSGDSSQTTFPEVTLGPGEWKQLDDVFAGTGFTQGWASISLTSGTGPYLAYAVFNDSGTNDGSFVPFEPDPLRAESRFVPVAVEAGPYTTELVLTNPSTENRTVELTYVESLSQEKGKGGTVVEYLAAGEQRLVTGLLDFIRSRVPGAIGPRGEGDYAGTLTARFLSGSSVASGFAGARVGSPAKTISGNYGVFAPGLSQSDTASGEAWVFGLKQDDTVRSNLAIAAAGNLEPMTFAIEVYNGETGVLAGTTENITLGPGGWKQFSGLLSALGVTQGYARVVVRSGTGRFAAYGVVNDGAVPGSSTATDDGSYWPFTNR
jgi:hypothetical protein